MRVARVGSIRMAFAAVALAIGLTGAAPEARAASQTPNQAFKVTISPEYATAGEPTTFQVTIVNVSGPGTTLGSVKVTPPTGFAPPQPTVGTPLRRETKVQFLGGTPKHGAARRPGRTTRRQVDRAGIKSGEL
jgi:hypothetical protein